MRFIVGAIIVFVSIIYFWRKVKKFEKWCDEQQKLSNRIYTRIDKRFKK